MSSYQPYTIPISVKGIVFDEGKVWLRKNQRGEWELPGGKIDKGEQPAEALIRELREELGFETEVIDLIEADIHTIPDSIDEADGVLILTYLCQLKEKVGEMEQVGDSGKQAEFKQFADEEIIDLPMPQFYKDALNQAW